MDPFYQENQLNYWLIAQKHGAFIGRTTDVSSPTLVSFGHQLSTQQLTISFERHLCGHPKQPRRVIDFPIQPGTHTASGSSALAPWLTQIDGRVIYLIGADDVTGIDTNLSALPADPATIAWLIALCRQPAPRGVAGLLQIYADNATDPKSVADLRQAGTVVIDFNSQTAPVRLTLHKGVLRVFSGVLFTWVRASRGPDLTIETDAVSLHAVLTGAKPATAIGLDHERLLAAISRITPRIKADSTWRKQLHYAGFGR